MLNTSTIKSFLLHEPIYGAYTELFAGLSPEVTASKNGAWSKQPTSTVLSLELKLSTTLASQNSSTLSSPIMLTSSKQKVIPWGRFAPALRPDLVASLKTKAEGGTGIAAEFWEWSEEQVKAYVWFKI